MALSKSVIVEASPSLALIKYWGKQNVEENLPATSSLAVTLQGLTTRTRVSLSDQDQVKIGSEAQNPLRYAPFFDRLRKEMRTDACFSVASENSFPTAAGLASSSSGFAALTLGCMALVSDTPDIAVASDLARLGSASAARSFYEGFTLLPRGSRKAEALFPEDHWPELRVLIAVVQKGKKSVPTREAMERCRSRSPMYDSWLSASEPLYLKAISACREKDLEALGTAMRQSYLSMFATMFSAIPPIVYWQPETVALIQECERLRSDGISVWETMDAGPQVKILCLASELEEAQTSLRNAAPSVEWLVSRPGPGARVVSREGN